MYHDILISCGQVISLSARQLRLPTSTKNVISSLIMSSLLSQNVAQILAWTRDIGSNPHEQQIDLDPFFSAEFYTTPSSFHCREEKIQKTEIVESTVELNIVTLLSSSLLDESRRVKLRHLSESKLFLSNFLSRYKVK